jgi:hypothetical protein
VKHIYTSSNILLFMKMNTKLNYSITNMQPLNFDMYSFIHIVSSYYELQPVITERIIYISNLIFSRSEKQYSAFFANKFKYENIILGITLFALYEYRQQFAVNFTPFNLSQFIDYLYGPYNKNNIIQIYCVYINLQEIFGMSCEPAVILA